MDYRQMFSILEDVVEAKGRRQLCQRLSLALGEWLGWEKAFVADTPAFAALREKRIDLAIPHFYSSIPRSQLEDFLQYWTSCDPLTVARGLTLLRERDVVSLADLAQRPAPFIDGPLRPHGVVDVLITLTGNGDSPIAFGVQSPGNEGSHEGLILAKLKRQLAPVVDRDVTAGEKDGGWPLTPREREIAELVSRGLDNRQIAKKLSIRVDTVKKHLSHILAKMNLSNRTQLALLWQRGRPGGGPWSTPHPPGENN
jgi:DNA-binding CsgD family transcriptional regulator